MNKKLFQALVLNFALSWGLAAIFKLAGFIFTGINTIILGVIYMFMPALSVVILSKFFWKIPLKNWGIKKPQNKFVFLAWTFPFILTFLSIVVALFFPGIKFQPGMEGIFARYESVMPPESLATMKNQVQSLGPLLPLIILAESIIAGLTVNTIVTFGEEYFWRGFLLKQLKRFGWIKSSLIIGFIWGLWHAPLIAQGHNYPEHPILGIFMMIIWCILISFSIVYFTVKTKSVFTAAFFHGLVNAIAGAGILWISKGSDLLVGVTGLAGFIALLILNSIIYILDKKSPQKVDSLINDY